MAIKMGHTSTVRILLRNHQANLNIVGPRPERDMPLHLAVNSNRLDIVEWLIAAGADVNLRNAQKKSPLDLARQLHPNSRIFNKLREQSLMKVPTQDRMGSKLRQLDYPASAHEKEACESTLIFVIGLYSSRDTDYHWTIVISVHELLHDSEPLPILLKRLRPGAVDDKSLACVWIHFPDNNVRK